MTLSKMKALLDVMAKLRDKEHGCPWDIEQNFASIAPYTLEEAYEVVDAIEREDWSNLREELGDLLLQVVFHARMAEELGLFDFTDVADAIHEKMIRRHPHVFGDAAVESASAQKVAWENAKEAERAHKNNGALGDVPNALPALVMAEKLQGRAARVGFDWPDALPVYDKVEEELDELRRAASPDAVEEEFGDLLFACVNLGRKLNLDPEQALRTACRKFRTRFEHMEAEVRQNGTDLKTKSIDELEALWQSAKSKSGAVQEG